MPQGPNESGAPPGRFAGTVALVTGGNSGIGAEVARAFALAGASVVVAARREQAGRQVVNNICAHGGQAVFVPCEVTHADSVQALVQACVDHYGRLDYAFNGAGITGTINKEIADYEESVFDETFAVNVKGTWLCMKYQIPAMLASGGGTVVNCSSTAGLRGGARASAYYGSKHAVLGLTKSVALEYATRGVRVNAVCPGLVMTELVHREFAAVPDKLASLAQRIPMGRPGTVAEIAGAVLWLCSPEAGYVTGAILSVDGGFVI